MRLPRPLRAFDSLRTTVVLLVILSLLLFLSVVLPQADVLGQEAFEAWSGRSAIHHFVLATLGFGEIVTSPIFLGVLVFFFVNLGLVLVERAGPIRNRLRRRRRSEAGLKAWARTADSLSAPLPEGWDLQRVVETLRGFGYRPEKSGERTFFGAKHRSAALGFLLFHLSFFLLAAGGALIYATRFTASAFLSEGQEFTGQYQDVMRRPPLGDAPDLRFTLEEVDPRFERGEPVHLSARLLFESQIRDTQVNHPAEWGTASVLVRQAGVTPVLWLQDRHGYTLDRVAVTAATRGLDPTEAPLHSERYLLLIHPPAAERPFPTRAELSSLPIELSVFDRDDPDDPRLVFTGILRPGEAAAIGDDRLVLEEVRFWAGVQVVSERGGGLLVAGFIVGIAGLVWRLVFHRREVALTWDEASFRLVGHSEYYPRRFRGELEALFAALRAF